MNAKYALALILTLQVSMSLCEIPTPSAELVAKYDAMKAVFYKRLLTAFGKVQAAAAPIIETSAGGPDAKAVIEDMRANTIVQAAVQVLAGIGEEAVPLLDKTRSATLGLYEHYLRAYIGEYLDHFINNTKFYRDTFMPIE